MIPIISQLPEPISTVVLLSLIAIAFIVAYKIMKIVMQTAIVTVLSAGFYLALVWTLGYPWGLDYLLFYSFLGAGMFITFTFISRAIVITERMVSIPYRIIKATLMSFFGSVRHIRARIKRVFSEKQGYNGHSEQKLKSKVKAVLDKMKRTEEYKSLPTEQSDDDVDNGNDKMSQDRTKEVVLDKVMEEEEDKDEK